MRALHLLPLLCLLLLPVPPSVAVAAPSAPAPGLDGVWTGTMSGTTYSFTEGVAPVKVKIPVTMVGSDGEEDYGLRFTLHLPGPQDYTYEMVRHTGRGSFWASGGPFGEFFVMVGTVGGKAPRLKLKAHGIKVSSFDVQDLTISLKRNQETVRGIAVLKNGAALGSVVTVKDRNGASSTGTAFGSGHFVLDTTGMTPPFLVKIDYFGTVLYGYAPGPGVANVHPYSDFILRTWYGVDGSDLDATFDALGPASPLPSALEIDLLEGLVRRTVRKWLADAGTDPDAFNLLRSPFPTDNTGFDRVIKETTFAPDGSSLAIFDLDSSQQSDVVVSTAAKTVTVATTTTSASGTSMSVDGTVLPAEGPVQDAVDGALAAMDSFRAKVKARGGALTASDLAGFLTTDFMDDGRSRAVWTAEIATALRGAGLDSIGLRSVASFDGAAGIVVLDLELTESVDGEAQTDRLPMAFKKTGSTWLLLGNRRIAKVGVQVEYRTDYLPGSIDGPRKSINVDVRAPVGTISSVAISGGGIFSSTDAPKDARTDIKTFHPTPSTDLVFEENAFFTGGDLADFPVPGTEFQVVVTPVAGSPQMYTVVSGGTTTETVSILQPGGHGLAADAHPGTPFSAQWTLPKTFAVQRVKFSGHGFTTNFSCGVDPDSPLPLSATQGTATLPATCGGEALSSANFNLSFEGPNGERIMIIYEFE